MGVRRVLAMVLLCLGSWGCRGLAPAAAFDPDRVPDAFRGSGAALAWPGATRAVRVEPDGCLYDGAHRLRLSASAAAPSGERAAAPPRRIAYEDRWRPVAHWVERAGDVTFDFEAVALPQPETPLARAARALRDWQRRWVDAHAWNAERERLASSQGDRWDRLVVRSSYRMPAQREDALGILVSLEVRARNAGTHDATARLRAAFERPGSDEAFRAGDSTSTAVFREDGADALALGFCQGGRSTSAERRLERRLAPGETATWRIVLSTDPMSARRLREWARVPHERRADDARAYWSREMERGTRFELGDLEVEQAIAAARVVLLECRERRDSGWVPLGSPFQYRDVWLRDGARAIAALSCHGYVAEARAMAAGLLAWQWPHGPFVSQGAQLDGTGQALWAFEQSQLRPRPSRDVGRYAASAFEAWSWCERIRRSEVGAPVPEDRMLPIADPHDDELVRGRLVGTDAWALAGYRSAERLLAAAGRTADAARVAQSALAYRADFARAIAGFMDVPPSYSVGGRDWGNLAVAYPCAALPAGSPKLATLARRYWAEAGGAGLGFYGSADSLHGYVAADLATWALEVGHRAEADSVLDALLRWRDATGGGAEVFSRGGEFGNDLPPHATSAAALLQLTRNMLVEDSGDRLELTLGARARWWRGSQVLRAPTRWGMLSFQFGRTETTAHWRWTPVSAWTALTLPPGTHLRGVLPSPLVAGERRDVVLAPPGTGSAVVAIARD